MARDVATLSANPTIVERRWTAEEYRRLPEGPPYYELEDGELIEMVRPRGRHQRLILRLGATLEAYLRQQPIGEIWPEVAVFLTPRHVYIPDLSFLLTENLGRFADDVAIQGPPDLVIEVISPSTASRDKAQKLRAYHAAGVPWYWLVEAESLLITEYRYTPDGYLVNQIVPPLEPFAPALFPGLSVRMADLTGASNLEEEPHE
jgi:Uma2 family endonuclease